MKYLNILLTTWALLFSSLVFATENTGRYDNLTTNNPSKTSIGVNKDVDISSTGGLYIPKGTTGQRPTPTKDGLIRFNSTTGKTELYANSAWGTIGGGLSAWATATVYAVGDIVIQTNKIYKCIAGHTSGTFATDLGNNDWVEVSAGVSDHTQLTNIGTNTHAQIDTAIANSVAHIANTSNPHAVTAAQVGLGNVNNTSDATKNSATATLTNKTIDGLSNTLTNITATTNANLTGEVTSVGNAATVTNSAVIAKTLTGFSSAAGTISATDSILQALQKADGNTALKLGNTKADVDGSPVSTTQLNYPNAQATTISGSIRRVETGSSNLLADPSFEKSTLPDWSCTLGTKSQDTNNHTDGSGSLKIVSAGAGIRCQQISTTNAASLKGQQMVARLSVNSTDSALQACAVVDGTDTNCTTVPVTDTNIPFKSVEIPFIAGGTSNGIALKSTTTTVQSIYADEAMAGKMAPFQNVNGAQLLGTIKIVCSGGNYSTSSTSYVDFTAQTGCTYTTTGQALAPSTMIPGVKFASISPGDLKLEAEGDIGSEVINKSATFQFWDGSNTAKEESYVYAGSSITEVPGISQSISYSTTQSNVTLSIRAKASSAGNAFVAAGSANPLVIKVWYFPPASRIYSQATTELYHAIEFSNASTTWSSDGLNVSVLGAATKDTNAGLISIGGSSVVGTRFIALKPIIVDISASGGTPNSSILTIYKNTVTALANAGPAAAFGGTMFYEASAHVKLDTGEYLTISRSNGNWNSINTVTIKAQSASNYIVGSFAGIEKCANDYECTDKFSADITPSTNSIANQNIPWLSSCTGTGVPETCTLNTNLKDGSSGLSSAMNCTATAGDQASPRYYGITSTTSQLQIRADANATTIFHLECQKGTNDFKPKTGKVASSIGVPTVPGITTTGTGNLLDIFEVDFGTTNTTTVCSANPCFIAQKGNAAVSVGWATPSTYTLTTTKTYSHLSCDFVGQDVSGYSVANINTSLRCDNCNALSAQSVRLPAGTTATTYGTWKCKGWY